MRGRGMRLINCILAVALCLSLLTACGSDAGAIVPTEGSQSMADGVLDSNVSNQMKPEAENTVFYPITYQVDISHDEIPEELTVSQTEYRGETHMKLTVIQDGVPLWSDELDLTEGMSKKAYYLCSVGGEDFLAAYRSYLADGSYRYIFEVFDLENGKIRHVDNNSFLFGVNAAGGFPADSVGLKQFSDWMNRYLNRGFLLGANTGDVYTYSTVDVQKTYQETFDEVFVPAESYSDCATLAAKAERYNALHDQYEGSEAVVLTKPEGFDEAAAEMLAENADRLQWGELFSLERKLWFADYKDWEIQVVRTDSDYTSPLDSENAVFYYPSEDMAVEEIAAEMLEYLVAEGTVPSDERTFVVKNYRILEQRLKDMSDSWGLCLRDWYEAEPSVQANIRAYVRDWLLYRADASGFIPVEEDMWYFIPRGYFSYSGECGGMTMGAVMSEYPELVVGDKVPLVNEENAESVVFVLMKLGNVYRLQSIEGMLATYEEMQKQ